MRDFYHFLSIRQRNLFLPFAVAAVIIFVIATVWHFAARDNFDTVVEGSMYRSAQLTDRRLLQVINKYHIRSVINLRGVDNDASWYQHEKALLEEHAINYYTLDFSAQELPRITELNRLVHYLTNAPKPLLLHCHGGAHRTGIASALALIIFNNASLASAKRQFSWRYRVPPWDNSIGHQFFSSYESWLATTGKKHSKEVMLSWISHYYHDAQGNFAICSDWVNTFFFDRIDKANKIVNIVLTSADEPLVIKGWAFDGRTLEGADGLVISIKGIGSDVAEYLYDRPDVADYFRFRKETRSKYLLGWRAEIQGEKIEGCHEIIYTVGKEHIKMLYTEKVCISFPQ